MWQHQFSAGKVDNIACFAQAWMQTNKGRLQQQSHAAVKPCGSLAGCSEGLACSKGLHVVEFLDFFEIRSLNQILKLGSVAGQAIQENEWLSLEDDLRSGGLLCCVSQWTRLCTEFADGTGERVIWVVEYIQQHKLLLMSNSEICWWVQHKTMQQ